MLDQPEWLADKLLEATEKVPFRPGWEVSSGLAFPHYVGSATAATQVAAVLLRRGRASGGTFVQSNSVILAIFSSSAHGRAMCRAATFAIALRFSSGRRHSSPNAAKEELCMKTVSRRRAITLASSFAAAPLLSSIDSLAQPGPPATVFDMAKFTAASPDHDAAFAKAVAAISEAAAAANKAGRPVHIVLNLDKNAIYRIKRPIVLKQLSGIEVHGNGAQLINTARASTLQISDASHVTIRDLTIDYDPLAFTQGTIASFDHAAREIIVKVDPGYPDDPALLATITDGFFEVMDRRTRALKPGARDFLSPSRVERVKDGVIKVHLQWGANDRFPSQLPIAVGDVVAITNSSGAAIGVTGSVSTTLIDLKLLASPGMGIMEDAGAGGTRLQKVSIVPGPRRKGATTDRLPRFRRASRSWFAGMPEVSFPCNESQGLCRTHPQPSTSRSARCSLQTLCQTRLPVPEANRWLPARGVLNRALVARAPDPTSYRIARPPLLEQPLPRRGQVDAQCD
jgi:hypothetical protein